MKQPGRMLSVSIASALLLAAAWSLPLGLLPSARGEATGNPWPRFSEPAPGPAHAIGDYSAGCLQGAQPLALDGVGYQVMRPSRKRYYGHPALIDLVQKLGRRVHQQKLGVLLIGDLSQARGGRAASGHASHQTGLDVDVWFSFPARARRAPLPLKAREELPMESILDKHGRAIRPAWKKHVEKLLKLTVQDERVERVFVNPVIKRELCTDPGEHAWLRKVRPWYGHEDHFHIRLGCVAGDADCQAQVPLPQGDGCDKLTFWFTKKTKPQRKQQKHDYQEKVDRGRGWPARCEELLAPDPMPSSS
ncbi:MAG: penicillin-insensitive murein endopeptidase [Myxococcaceae bacterium]|nr:penicillin-insensitive murein endopeptidase [Myxococcaceae bacterium]